jgi:glycosyltransferase involved in cell wall biosynthesis
VSRVVLVGKGPPAQDGIATFLQALQSGLAGRQEVRLVNLTRDGAREGGRLTASNVTRTLRDARDVWRAGRGADVVHVHSALAPSVTMLRAGILAMAGRLRGARAIVHAHGGQVALWLTTGPRRLLARAALAPAGLVIAVSDGGMAALTAALGPRRVRLVDNGVDLAAFGPPPRTDAGPERAPAPPRVLYAGFLTPRKGLIDLFEASARLLERGVDHEVLVAGGTPPEGSSAEEEVRRAAGPAVRFLGAQPHAAMPGRYLDADIYCLPSWWEAMPLSVLEAMAAGLPVVATRVGDVARAVEDGVTGRLVPPRNPTALAEALEPLLRDPEQRRAMGAAARRRVEERFDAARTIEAVDALYREVTA